MSEAGGGEVPPDIAEKRRRAKAAMNATLTTDPRLTGEDRDTMRRIDRDGNVREEEQMDESELAAKAKELLRKGKNIKAHRREAAETLSQRFGVQRGSRVPGTEGFSWYDNDGDSMWVIQKNAEVKELPVGGMHDFGSRDQHVYKIWKGRQGGGWTDPSREEIFRYENESDDIGSRGVVAETPGNNIAGTTQTPGAAAPAQTQQPQQPGQLQGQHAVPPGPAAAAVQPQAPGVAAGAEPTPQQLQEQLRQLQEQLTRVQTESAQLTQREVDAAERRAREQYGALALASLDALGITDPVARDTLVNTFKQFPIVAERPNQANDAAITAENTAIRERNERNRQVREVFAKRRWKIWQKAQRVSDETGLKTVGEAVLQDQRQPWWKKLGVDGAITGAFMGTGLGYGAWAALGALGCLGSIAATPFVAVGAGAVGGYRFMRRGLDRDNAIGRGNSFMHRNPTVSAAVFGALCGYDAGMLSNPVVRSDMAGFFGKLVGNIQSSIGSLFQLVAGTRLPLPPGVSISI